jgi:hypothetical protein
MEIYNLADADRFMQLVRGSAARAYDWVAKHSGDPFDMLRSMKFETVGFHPVQGHPLNFIEQVNQTWTFAVAIMATRQLLEMHPEAKGFRLAPGAHAAQPLDIMSLEPGIVGAETFAAVHWRNNGKLAKDIKKLTGRSEKHRYVFFAAPGISQGRQKGLETHPDVQVHAVKI